MPITFPTLSTYVPLAGAGQEMVMRTIKFGSSLNLPFGLRLLPLLGMMLVVMSAALAQAVPPKALRVVGDDNYPPFLFRDPTGHAVGYVADWWALWERKTGVKVELNATGAPPTPPPTF